MPCSKGMLGCSMLCGHRLKVDDYRAERLRQVEELVEATGGYETEMADRIRELDEAGCPVITFKRYLIQTRRTE